MRLITMNYSGLMDFKIIGIVLGLVLLIECCEKPCTPDEYGQELFLNVPISVGADRQFFSVGDTLWVRSEFSKFVEVEGHENPILLEDFDFFPELSLFRMDSSGHTRIPLERIIADDDALEIREGGSLRFKFVEGEQNYSVNFGLILSDIGVMRASIFVDYQDREDYFHPAMFACGRDRRRVDVNFINPYTSRERFDEYFHLIGANTDNLVPEYEDFAAIASFVFEVLE